MSAFEITESILTQISLFITVVNFEEMFSQYYNQVLGGTKWPVLEMKAPFSMWVAENSWSTLKSEEYELIGRAEKW